MNKKVFALPIAVLSLGIASCSNNHIKRVIFQEKTFEEALKIHETIKKKQETTFLDKGTATIKYSVKMKGDARIDDVSFHNLDINFSAGYILSWSTSDNYLKIEGEKEVYYYKFGNYDNTKNQWWKFEEYEKYNGHKKQKYILENQESINIKALVQDTIDDYSTISIPTVFNLGIGLNGDVGFTSILTDANLVPDDMFDKDNHDYLQKLKNEYETGKEGYSLNLTYGSNDEGSVQNTMKGKLKAKDVHSDKRLEGYVNVDLFSSFKNNFISQAEYIISGNGGNTRTNHFNVNFNIYLSEEIEHDKCTLDNIKPADYQTIVI